MSKTKEMFMDTRIEEAVNDARLKMLTDANREYELLIAGNNSKMAEVRAEYFNPKIIETKVAE